jgi:hypothetical protein
MRPRDRSSVGFSPTGLLAASICRGSMSEEGHECRPSAIDGGPSISTMAR